MINFIAEKISSRYRKALEQDIERQLAEDKQKEDLGKILKSTTVGIGTETPMFNHIVSGSTSTEKWSSGNFTISGSTTEIWIPQGNFKVKVQQPYGVSGFAGTSGPSGVSGIAGTSGPSGLSGTSSYSKKSPYKDYADYIASNLDNSIKYTEYIAENLEKSINYAEYIAEKIDGSLKYGDWMNEYANSHKPKREIKRVFSPEDPYGEEDWGS